MKLDDFTPEHAGKILVAYKDILGGRVHEDIEGLIANVGERLEDGKRVSFGEISYYYHRSMGTGDLIYRVENGDLHVQFRGMAFPANVNMKEGPERDEIHSMITEFNRAVQEIFETKV